MINLLWTGGWDSTYRLCELVLVRKVPVQPIYLINQKRKSLYIELQTMESVLDHLNKHYTHSGKLVNEPVKTTIEEIQPCDFITECYQNLKRTHGRVAIQYERLARFAEDRSMSDIELCVCKCDRGADEFWSRVAVEFVEDTDGRFSLCKQPVDNNLELFRRFSFPLMNMKKTEMFKKAREYGFHKIMLKTWTCPAPRGSRPCGTCNPCRKAMREGIGFIVPWDGKFHYAKKMARLRIEKLLNSRQSS